MAQFMRHHIVDHWQAEVDQAPVQPDRAVRMRSAPAGAGTAQGELAPLHAQLRREVVQALGEQALGLAHQPGLHGVADLRLPGAMRQTHVQRQARYTR